MLCCSIPPSPPLTVPTLPSHLSPHAPPKGPCCSVSITTDLPSVGQRESTCSLPQLELFTLDFHSGLEPFADHSFLLSSPQLHSHCPCEPPKVYRINNSLWSQTKAQFLFLEGSNLCYIFNQMWPRGTNMASQSHLCVWV